VQTLLKQRRVAEQQAVIESLRAGQPIKGAVSANPIIAGLQNITKSFGGYTQPDLYPAQLGGRNVLVGGPGSQLMPVNVGGQTLYPMKSGDKVIYRSTSETTPQNTFFRQEALEPEPGPLTKPTPIITGLTPTGEVDRTQSDEYKSIRAQYDQARKELPAAVARDKGLELWAQANPELAARAEAAKYGTFNPLMQSTFGYQTGEAPDQVQRSMVIGGQRYDVDPEAIQYQIDQQRMQDMDTGNPLMQSAMQQQRTADQAAEATTAGMNRPIIDRADAFIEMSKKGFPKQSSVMFPTQALF